LGARGAKGDGVKVIRFFSRIAGYIASVTIAAVMMLTVADVFMRYVFARPITGTTEMVEFMMVVLVLAVVPAALANRHVSVDVLTEHLTPKGKALFDAVTLIGSSWLVAIMGWRALKACAFMIRNDVRSPTLDIAVFPFYVIVGLAFIFLFIAMIALAIQRIIEVARA
jgi:TRAP-type C4-dicarboxylate transport system permease small subunit